MSKINLWLIIYITIFVLSGCATRGPASLLCVRPDPCNIIGVPLLQKAVDKIISANFPDEQYKAVVWKDDFKNAWVTTGKTINMTSWMLTDLNNNNFFVPNAKVHAVVAHELAHLKKFHYHQNVGATILANFVILYTAQAVPGSGQYTQTIGRAGLATFSRTHEAEADRVAVEYMRKAGYKKQDFIDLLQWMLDNLGSSKGYDVFATHPPTQERIDAIRLLP